LVRRELLHYIAIKEGETESFSSIALKSLESILSQNEYTDTIDLSFINVNKKLKNPK